MNTASLAQILSSVQFTAAPDGRRLAILDADDWQGLLEWLEDVEDQRIIQAALNRLRVGPEAAGAVSLDEKHCDLLIC